MHSIISTSIGLLVIIEFFFSVILVLGMFYQSFRNTRVLSSLELGFIILVVGNFFSILVFEFELVQDDMILGMSEIFLSVLWVIAPIAIYYHYEQRNRNDPIYSFTLTLIGLAVLSTTITIIGITLPDVPILEDYHMILEFIAVNTTDFLFVMVFGFAFHTNYKALKLSDERGVKFELVGTAFIAVGFFIIVALRTIGTTLGLEDPTVASTQIHDPLTIFILLLIFSFFFLVNVGILILLLNIIIHPNFAYNLPIPVVNFMIYNGSGLAVYSKFTEVPEIDISFEEQLLSGALKAVSALIEETLGTDASLDHFDAGKFQIFFHQMRDQSSMLVVISMGASPFIRRSMRRFTSEMNDETLDQLSDSEITDSLISEIDDSLQVAFPYINLN